MKPAKGAAFAAVKKALEGKIMDEGLFFEIDKIMASCGMSLWGGAPFCKIEDSLIECGGMKRLPDAAKTVIVALFPYYCAEAGGQISRYAAAKDYHIVAKKMLNDAAELLKKRFGGSEFVPFCDASPVPEVLTAEIAGLGVVGRNGLLITEKYGSYVFIGEIVTDLTVETLPAKRERCLSCGLCVKKCPAGAISERGVDKERCVSHITQKKGELSPEEQAMLKKSGTIWGCDLCQSICPMNSGAKETYIEDFKKYIINTLSADEIEKNDFKEKYFDRAFLWRGKNVLRRNACILLGPTENNNQENSSK